VTLMCQEDLDNVIQLMNSPGYTSQSSPGSSPGSSCPEFNIRLFKEPSPVSSPDGAFIRSPDVEPPLGVCFCMLIVFFYFLVFILVI